MSMGITKIIIVSSCNVLDSQVIQHDFFLISEYLNVVVDMEVLERTVFHLQLGANLNFYLLLHQLW